jgi:DNA-binding XRE family transcriptional regulator
MTAFTNNPTNPRPTLKASRRRRDSPALLPKKLLAIRRFLSYRQAEMASSLQAKIPSRAQPYKIKARSISAYENGHRKPNLLVIVAYAHLAKVHLEFIADDRFTLKEFREQLGKHTLSHK